MAVQLFIIIRSLPESDKISQRAKCRDRKSFISEVIVRTQTDTHTAPVALSESLEWWVTWCKRSERDRQKTLPESDPKLTPTVVAFNHHYYDVAAWLGSLVVRASDLRLIDHEFDPNV